MSSACRSAGDHVRDDHDEVHPKPTAMIIDGAFGNDAAEAIGVATEVLGSAITSIAAMKMVMVPMPRIQAQKCRIPHA